MSLPIIAIINASTCLSDAQVKAVLPALQKQVSDDFQAYWELDCTLSFLSHDELLTNGWWQIAVLDNPDQAGALGYHELTSQGAPLGKIFAKLDLDSGSSWTATLSHELLEMLADPWINWCAFGSDNKLYALEVCDAVEADNLGYFIDGVLVSDFVTRHGSSLRVPTAWTSKSICQRSWSSLVEVTFQYSMKRTDGRRLQRKARAARAFFREAADRGEN
jgi:hypothetical protein